MVLRLGATGLPRRVEVDTSHFVYNASAFCERHLRRGDLNPLVNLNGVTVDDFAAKTQRQLDSQHTLAGRGRTNDGDDGCAGILPAFFLYLKVVVGMNHPREMISRIAMTSQMMASKRIAPMIWLRENRMVYYCVRDDRL